METTTLSIPVLRPGRWKFTSRHDWAEDDLHQLVDNFRRMRGKYVCPLKLGHSVFRELPEDAEPALGVARRLWIEGDGAESVLWAEFEKVPVTLAESVRDGRYTTCSAELRDAPTTGPLTSRTRLLAVALLGACASAVDLGDLSTVARMAVPSMAHDVAGSADPAEWNVRTGDAVPPAPKEARMMHDLRADLERINTQVTRLSEHTAALLTRGTGDTPRDRFSAALLARIGELNLNPEEPEVRQSVADQLCQRPEFAGMDPDVIREVVAGVSTTKDGLDAAKARLAEVQRDVARLEGQRAARQHDVTQTAPGAGTHLAQASTMPDERDGHTHSATFDPETGVGQAGEAGEPPHVHEIREAQVVPTDLGGVRSSHPGPLVPASPSSDVAPMVGKKGKNSPLTGTFPAGVRVPLSESYDARSRRIRDEAADAGTLPLVGSQVAEAEALGDRVELGERARFDQLRAIADKFSLDLRRPSGRAQAERRLWDALGSTVRTARVFDEALRCIERAESLKFHENAHEQVAATKLLARLRPDLCGGDYGRSERAAEAARVDAAEGTLPLWWPRDMPTGPVGSEPYLDAQLRVLNDLVDREAQRLGLFAGSDDASLYELRQKVLKANPHLKPGAGGARSSMALGS